MKTLLKVATKIKGVKDDIRKMKKVSELINYIPEQAIEKFAYILLVIWILSPILMMFRKIFLNYGDLIDHTYSKLFISIIWFTLLQQIGYIGFCFGIVFFWKSVLQAEVKNICLYQYLSSNLFTLFLFLMLIWSVFSCLASDNISLSFLGDHYRNDGLRTYIAYCGIFCCGYIVRDKRLVQRLVEYFTLVAALLSVLVLINIKAINDMFGLTTNMAVFNNINHFGYYICLALMCSMLLFLIEKSGTLRLLRITQFAIITAALVQNNSFGPYLAVIVGLICCVVLFIWLDRSVLKRVFIIVIVFLSISLAINISNKYLSNDLQRLFVDMGNIISGSKDADKAGSDRWKLWLNGLKFAVERPLFGYGQDNLSARYTEVGIAWDRPHNEIIQFAASLGIPAAFFYISAQSVHFVSFIKLRKHLSVTIIGIFCAVITYLVSSLFGNTMYYTTPFFFMILGLSAGMLKSVLLDTQI